MEGRKAKWSRFLVKGIIGRNDPSYKSLLFFFISIVAKINKMNKKLITCQKSGRKKEKGEWLWRNESTYSQINTQSFSR